MKKAKTKNGNTNANLGLEAKLWAAADALRNNMDAAEYKHVFLGLIFLKYISDAFEAKHAELETQKAEGADAEDPDEYRAVSIFWVPKEARWSYLKDNAPQATIGKLVDDAMEAIERDNPSLKGVLPKDYARPGLDKQRLGQLINLVSDIGLGSPAVSGNPTAFFRFPGKPGECIARFITGASDAEDQAGEAQRGDVAGVVFSSGSERFAGVGVLSARKDQRGAVSALARGAEGIAAGG